MNVRDNDNAIKLLEFVLIFSFLLLHYFSYIPHLILFTL